MDADHPAKGVNFARRNTYLTREEKLTIIDDFASIDRMPWQRLRPNAEGDWINQRDPAFDAFVPLGDKDGADTQAIFDTYSQGVLTSRDAWAYNSGREVLASNMGRMIETYETERGRYARACAGLQKDEWPPVEKVVDTAAKKISWSANLKTDVMRNKPYAFEDTDIVRTMYRPFQAQWGYFNRRFNERVYQQPRLFPTPRHDNLVICAAESGANKAFSAFVTASVPDYELVSKGQGFPLYYYEHPDDTRGRRQSEMFTDTATPDAEGYIRRDAISDWALGEFRRRYADDSITKEDIFWYVYGILHSPEYKDRFASDLKKMVPRIPYAADFRAFSDAGRELGQWHLGYETVEPYPLEEECKRLVMEDTDFRVHKMVFGKRGGEKDKSVIVYNPNLTLKGIPLNAYDYVVNGKSALDWVMERYAVSIHKESGIKNDPNDWSTDLHYIIDLVKRIVRVSVETVRIVATLPALGEQV